MMPPIFQFCVLGRREVFYPSDIGIHKVHVNPRVGGYGFAVRDAWQHARDAGKIGVIVLEHDIAVPREAWDEMEESIHDEPNCVIAVPYVLYPASTGLAFPVWAHRSRIADGRFDFIAADAPCPSAPAAFSLGCTFLPSRLLIELPDDLRQWDFPVLDTRLSELAQEIGVKALTTETPAVHLHY